jgi:CheY-like chemotaxis protein
MPRFLIVEDEQSTLDALTLLIRTEFPDAEIAVAASLPEARSVVSQTHPQYDVAILDVMLPEAQGGHPEADVNFCCHIAKYQKAARVIHVTAHADENSVRRHIEEFHSLVEAPWFSKSEAGYAGELLKDLKAFIHGHRIRAKCEMLLGVPGAAPAEGAAARRSSGAGSGLTFDLADLCLDVAEHLEDLGPKDRQLIDREFWVDRQEDGNYLVTLRRTRTS